MFQRIILFFVILFELADMFGHAKYRPNISTDTTICLTQCKRFLIERQQYREKNASLVFSLLN